MDSDEERVLYLSRLGHEKIIKYGTYDVKNARPITQNHPFYEYKSMAEGEAYLRAVANRGEDDDGPIELDVHSDAEDTALSAGIGVETEVQENEPPAQESSPPAEDADPDALASEILSSNFKVGMSQSEVDDFLKGLLENN